MKIYVYKFVLIEIWTKTYELGVHIFRTVVSLPVEL